MARPFSDSSTQIASCCTKHFSFCPQGHVSVICMRDSQYGVVTLTDWMLQTASRRSGDKSSKSDASKGNCRLPKAPSSLLGALKRFCQLNCAQDLQHCVRTCVISIGRRTPLTALSLKKTVEGFVDAFFSTIVFGLLWVTYLLHAIRLHDLPHARPC